MTVDLRPVTNAVRDHLDAGLPDHVTVEAGERTVDPPVAVVQPLAGGEPLDMIASTWNDGDAPWQVACVGGNREQAEWLADQVRSVLLGSNPSGVKFVRPDSMGYGAMPDRDVDPPVWESTPVFYLTV